MKQKRLGDILYVFDVNPYEITQDTDATTIKVQEESYKGFVKMNSSLAEKIVKYNYHVICVNTPEWAPYVDEEDPQEQLTFSIYGSAAASSIHQIQVQNADNVVIRSWVQGVDLEFPFQASFDEGQHFTVEFADSVNPDTLNITGDALSIGWQDQETSRYWKATPALSTSTSVGIEPAEPATYRLNLSGENINDTNLRVDINHNQAPLVDLINGIDIAQDTLVEVWLLTEDIKDYDVSSISSWMNQSTEGGLHYWRNMPAEDKTIDIPFIPSVTFDLLFGDAQHNLSVSGINTLSFGSTNFSSSTLEDYNTEYHASLRPGHDNVTFYINPPYVASDLWYIKVGEYSSNFYTDPVTGKKAVKDAGNSATWTFDDNPQSGLPWVSLSLPETDPDGNAWTDHSSLIINGQLNEYEFGISYMGEPENLSKIEVINTADDTYNPVSITGNDLTNSEYTTTAYGVQPTRTQIKFYVATGLPTDMTTFIVHLSYDNDGSTAYDSHQAKKVTNPDTGEVSYIDELNYPGIWTYDNNPSSGLPWIAFTMPAYNALGNAWGNEGNSMQFQVEVSGS